MLSFGVVCGFICSKYNITKADKTLKRSTEGLNTTNFRRLPRLWKAQDQCTIFFHEVQVQGKVNAKKILFVVQLRPETENRVYHLMKNHVTILTMYCVKAIENNDF